jgi:hypothetical protein
MAQNSWKEVFVDTYPDNLFFHTQICSLGQQVVFNYPIVSPKVPTTLVIPNSYPMGHYSRSLVTCEPKKAKNGWKQVFDDTYFHNLLFYPQVWANKGCLIILWYHPRCLLHLWPHMITLWATITIHLLAKNGWKQVFDITYHHNLLFYTQVCCMGQ